MLQRHQQTHNQLFRRRGIMEKTSCILGLPTPTSQVQLLHGLPLFIISYERGSKWKEPAHCEANPARNHSSKALQADFLFQKKRGSNMSVIDLMTAEMKAFCVMTNISPHFHLGFLMFDVVTNSNEQVKTLLPSESIFKQKVGLHCHAPAALY